MTIKIVSHKKKEDVFQNFLIYLSESNSETACCEFRKSGQMATRYAKMACAIALQGLCHRVHCGGIISVMDGCHRRAPLLCIVSVRPAHGGCVKLFFLCKLHVPSVYLYKWVQHAHADRIHWMYSTFTLVLWNFLSERHLCRIVSSVGNRGKKPP